MANYAYLITFCRFVKRMKPAKERKWSEISLGKTQWYGFFYMLSVFSSLVFRPQCWFSSLQLWCFVKEKYGKNRVERFFDADGSFFASFFSLSLFYSSQEAIQSIRLLRYMREFLSLICWPRSRSSSEWLSEPSGKLKHACNPSKNPTKCAHNVIQCVILELKSITSKCEGSRVSETERGRDSKVRLTTECIANSVFVCVCVYWITSTSNFSSSR